ncbi:acylneuraminate cytidylyltransferase family protein [Ramlibacter sp.]|uniref:acylneuraminate cytidylyltransferase family protein n=1 Tax=Ramlibacter sp. TaxID=1917967 RepID=UPI002D5005D9|nr:acylneuraminate cytidylyltransferase family protein [Ramlibacter sp.]HYD74988.1 acylneuraminate cytidylyltransferase family protein [Ramlibacter sp.]
MKQTDRILCVIGARGGSQGVPGKNIRPLLGKPVIAWAIGKALQVPGIARVVVSTDSEAIAEVARAAGAEVPFLRPAELASSDAGKFQVWQHALAACEQADRTSYDLYVDIDCTNPLIGTEQIAGAIDRFRALRDEGKRPDAVFTVSEARRNPYFNLVEPDAEGVLKMSKSLGSGTVLARQRAPAVYEHVAGTYVLATDYLRSAGHLLDGRAFGYAIAPDRAFDIDSELDFTIIEFLLRRQLGLQAGAGVPAR